MPASEEKKFLRKKLIKDRKKLTSLEVKAYSKKILNKLSNHIDWKSIKYIHLYDPINEYKEVDINPILTSLRQSYPDIRIEMAPGKLTEHQNMPEGRYYDLVVVPVLGFDRRGYRLGYGGGYYDKFLARNNCKQAIGLAYGFQEVEKLSVEKHDQKLDLVITEGEIIETT